MKKHLGFGVFIAACAFGSALLLDTLPRIVNAMQPDMTPLALLDGCPPLPALIRVEGHSDYVLCTYERIAE